VRKGQDNEPEDLSPAKRNAAAMKHVMSTLKHPGNPLTGRAGLGPIGEPYSRRCSSQALSHSPRLHTIDYMWSCTTGHQRGEANRCNTAYFKWRDAKVDAQRDPAVSTLFRGCRIYCNSECSRLLNCTQIILNIYRWILCKHYGP